MKQLKLVYDDEGGAFMWSDRALIKARLCVDYSFESSFKAIRLLRGAGFRVTATPVSGLSEPELTIGSMNYRGFAEIQQLVENVKRR